MSFRGVIFVFIAAFGVACAVQFETLNSTRNENEIIAPSPMDRITNLTLATMKRCLDKSDSVDCLRQKLLKALDLAIRDNGTWRVNEYIAFDRSPEFDLQSHTVDGLGRSEDIVDNTISGKLSQLMQSRRVQFHTNLVPAQNEGRKKKHKHGMGGGGGMMFGGIAMAALYAQVVLGKITMLAGAAFVLAKIALIVATMTSLKKHAGQSGGGSTEHIIYADGGGHGGGHEGYRRNTFRSMIGNNGEFATQPPYEYEPSDELRDRDIRFERMESLMEQSQ